MTGTVASLDIATTGTSASDNGVWVAVNDGGNVRLLHYEDIAGGTAYVWRSVGILITGATTSGDAKDVLSDSILINKSGLIYPQINEFIKKLNWNLTENLLNPSDVANEILSIIEKKDSNV